ncbi:MAG: hypothetical protein DMD95_17810 [Candidatus Rokuibacteriota bacterium]|nr:MAG: hypothetical protein DMD95_17810 [Candidatus Rokubacteria bacterium]
MRSGWIAVALTLALACFSFYSVAAQDKPIELKFSSWLAVVHGHHTGVMVPWAKMVEEKSGGRLKITIYPGSVLGKPADHYDMIKDGIADLGFTTPGYTPGRFPLITVTELPLGMFKSSRGGSLAVMSIFDKYFKNEFKDVKVLWFWVHPPGHFHLAKKQVKVLEDLQGLKIRAATPMLTTMVKTLGATPVSIPAPDTYTALERGTVDGTIFPWEAISSFKIAEVLKHHVSSGIYVAPLFTFMNRKKYDSLPPDLRKVIDDLSGNPAICGRPSSGTIPESGMHRWLDGCERVLTLMAALATFSMMLLTTADAGGRYLFNRPILAAYEVTTNYLMVAVVFLAMPYAYRQGANIRVTFLVDRLGRIPRLVVDHAVQIVSILYCAALVFATFQQARHMLTTGTTFATLDLPLWPAHMIVCIGLFLTTLMMAIDLGEVRKGRSSLFTGD